MQINDVGYPFRYITRIHFRFFLDVFTEELFALCSNVLCERRTVYFQNPAFNKSFNKKNSNPGHNFSLKTPILSWMRMIAERCASY